MSEPFDGKLETSDNYKQYITIRDTLPERSQKMKAPWEIKEQLRALENTLNAKKHRFDENNNPIEYAELVAEIKILKWVLDE